MISPVNLLEFLKSLEWELIPDGQQDGLYILRNPKFPSRQLVFPMEETAPDYEEALLRVVEKLEEMLHESLRSMIHGSG